MVLTPVIGFEVHAQLATRSKVFCSCPNEPGGPPNTRVCPVCLGLPGALPVLNEEALDLGIRVALALDATVGTRVAFARKNYFYPDLPKGYQITQFDAPLAVDGHLDIEVGGDTKCVRIRQVHLEEDAGKTAHTTIDGAPAGLIDMNRCGVPLVEIVTEPDISGLAEADAFLNGIHRLLTFIGVTGGRMHQGELRFDTNVSLQEVDGAASGRATEIKNLNSFRAVRRALAYEIERQTLLLGRGESVVHETLLWDAAAGRALPMRSKEEEHDYRYFPEPDLLPVTVDGPRLARARASTPELPRAMRERFINSYGIAPYDADVLTSDPDSAFYFEMALREVLRVLRPELGIEDVRNELLAHHSGTAVRLSDFPLPRAAGGLSETARAVGTWVTVIVPGIVRKGGARLDVPGTSGGQGERLPRLVRRASRLAAVLVHRYRGGVSESAAKTLFQAAADNDDPVDALAARLGLSRVSDEETLRREVRRVLGRHADEVRRYREGELKLLRFFMGEIMKGTGGAADPLAARAVLEEELSAQRPRSS
jgi:aspartyl-tRNA(Asn)/glutamyl-tRNA(Gln) amidotransferase subunit B